MKNILISGGSGYIGRYLTNELQSHGYKISWLTRKIKSDINISQYEWNWENKILDKKAIEKADAIIHLAGANIGAHRWSKKWKKEIYDSRIKSTELLFEKISESNPKPKLFISTSAIGFYGIKKSEKIFTENDKAGDDFLAQTCKDWETKAKSIENLGIRTVIVRNAIVFAKDSEAFEKIQSPIRKGYGAVIGSGEQYFNWIHLYDLCALYLKILNSENFKGIYNVVAPEFITNKQVTKSIADHHKKLLWLPKIPSIFIKWLIGEFSASILGGSRISAEKLLKEGFEFKYQKLEQFLKQDIDT